MPKYDGITPAPLVTEIITLPKSGLISFKFGPTLATEPASLSEWHAAQLPSLR